MNAIKKAAGCTQRLVDLTLQDFPSFRDEAEYNCQKGKYIRPVPVKKRGLLGIIN